MMQKTVKILNEEGLHARPAGIFVKCASRFTSTIEVEANGRRVNGKSIMSLMGLGLTKDTDLNIFAEGDDAGEAVDALVKLVNRKFIADSTVSESSSDTHA
jgi:phosphocarrier protein HPr